MATLQELMLRAQLLRQETAVDSISPERAGSIMYDTLAYINQMQLQDANPLLISKIYASVAAMEADSAPVSDLTGKPLRPGQVVCIVPDDETDPDYGMIYRYDGTTGGTSSWTAVGKLGSSAYLNGYIYAGYAVPATNPGIPQQKEFYFARTPGTYTYFKDLSNNSLVVANGEVVVLKYDTTSWSKDVADDFQFGLNCGSLCLLPNAGQVSDLRTRAVKELYIYGLDKTKAYYVYFVLYNGTRYFQLRDETKSNTVAQGEVTAAGVVWLRAINSSGIYGFAYFDGDISEFASSSGYVLIANFAASNPAFSPNIQNATRFLDYANKSTNSSVDGIGEIDELYFEGLNSAKTYNLLVDTSGSMQLFKVLESGTTVAQGYRTTDKKFIEIFQLNNSGIYGVIKYNGNTSVDWNGSTTIRQSEVTNPDSSPEIQNFIALTPISVGKGAGSYRFNSILRAVLYASNFFDKKITIDAGTYDLEDEFEDYYGADFFTNYQESDHIYGILLKNRMHLVFSSKAKVVFNYSGDNTDVKKYFSPFNADWRNADCHGFTLENATIEASNCRYCVHDERNGMTDTYENKYINCSMYIDNSRNSSGYPVCLGGGLGDRGYIEIRGCRFKSASYSLEKILASYHNSISSTAKSRVVVMGNYCDGEGTFKFSWYGTSVAITEILFANNSVGSPIVVRAETAESTTENIEVLQWNNEIRS